MSDHRLNETERLMQAAADNRLDPVDRVRWEQVLAADSTIRAEFEALVRLRAILRVDRDSLRAPVGLTSRIADAVAARREQERRASIPTSAWRAWSAAAAVLVLLGGSFVLGRRTASATGDPIAADLSANERRLVADHPELDRAEVERLFAAARERLMLIDRRSETERRTTLSELESAIESLVRKQTPVRAR